MKLLSKIFISGSIVAETGLHIGTGKTAMDIGGIDLSVMKTSKGVPFIPGSSLKGKLRSLLAREEGSEKINDDSLILKTIFGSAGASSDTGLPSLLIVRDAFLDQENFRAVFADVDLGYTEAKWENTINRKQGKADQPRQLERVPAGASFRFEMVYNRFDEYKHSEHLEKILQAMRLLQDDYLGGQGSRGYGKIRFDQVVCEEKNMEQYRTTNKRIVSDIVFELKG